jgi:hypothetical protein
VAVTEDGTDDVHGDGAAEGAQVPAGNAREQPSDEHQREQSGGPEGYRLDAADGVTDDSFERAGQTDRGGTSVGSRHGGSPYQPHEPLPPYKRQSLAVNSDRFALFTTGGALYRTFNERLRFL